MKSIDLLSHRFDEPLIRKIAFVHSLDMPLPKNDDWVERMYNVFAPRLHKLKPFPSSILDDEVIGPLARQVSQFPLIHELEWLRNNVQHLQSEFVFSHNDITRRNVLVLFPDDPSADNPVPLDRQVMLIDFGDCYYNHRAYDLACFLRCISSDYQLKADVTFDPYVHSEDHIRKMLKLYLDERRMSSNETQIDQLQFEVHLFMLLADLLTIMYMILSFNSPQLSSESWVSPLFSFFYTPSNYDLTFNFFIPFFLDRTMQMNVLNFIIGPKNNF